MWRGTMQAARSIEHLADGPDADGGGFIVESAPGTPGLIGLVFPWDRPHGVQPTDGRHPPRRAPCSRSPPTADRAASGSRGPAGRASTTRWRRRTAGRSRRGSRRAPASPGRADRGGCSPLGTPPAWFEAAGAGARADDAAAFAAYEARLRSFDFRPNRGSVASAHQMGSARAGGPADDYPCDPWGRVRTADARPGRDATIRGLYVGDASLFPDGRRREPDDHDDGLGAPRGADRARRGARRLTGHAARVRPRPARNRALRRPRTRPAPRRPAGATRPLAVTIRTTAATITTLATIVRGVNGSCEDDRAEDDGDDRVDVGVRGDPRQRCDRQQPGEGRVAHEAADDQQVQEAGPALRRDRRDVERRELAGQRAGDQQGDPAGDHLGARREQRGRGQHGPARRVDRAERPQDRRDQQGEEAGRVEVVDAGGRPGEDRDAEQADGDTRRRRRAGAARRRTPGRRSRATSASARPAARRCPRGSSARPTRRGPSRRAAGTCRRWRRRRSRGGSAAESCGDCTSATVPASRIPAGTKRRKPITNAGIVSTATLMPRYVDPQTR